MDSSTDFMRFLATLGVGGVLAGVIFFFYRKDVRSYTDLWKAMSDSLVTVVKENTRSNIELISAVKALHHRMDADEASFRRHDKRDGR